jgi:hypothetical protein
VRASSALCSRTLALFQPRREQKNGDRVQLGPPKATDPIIRMVRAGVTEDLPPGRHSLPEFLRKVASDASSTPSARNPFHVNATDTQRFSRLTVSATALADGTFSRMASSHARP